MALEPAPMPAPYQLLRKLRLFQGGGNLPFPEAGGYLDQPAWLMKCLEVCLEVEQSVSRTIGVSQGIDELAALLGQAGFE